MARKNKETAAQGPEQKREVVTAYRDEKDGGWVANDPDGIPTIIKGMDGLPSDYVGGPIHVEKSGLSYKFVKLAEKRNGETLPAVVEKQSLGPLESPPYDETRGATQRVVADIAKDYPAAMKAKTETLERLLNHAQEQMSSLEPMVQRFELLPKEERSRVLNELDALGLRLKITEEDSTLLPEDRYAGYKNLQRRIASFYDQLIQGERPKTGGKTKKGNAIPKGKPIVEPHKQILASLLEKMTGEQASPPPITFPKNTAFDPATGRRSDLRPVQEFKENYSNAPSSSSNDGGVQPIRKRDTSMSEHAAEVEGRTARKNNSKAEGIPEGVRKQYENMDWEEFLNTITAKAPELSESIQRFVNAHVAYLVLEASSGEGSDDTKGADTAVMEAKNNIEQTAQRIGMGNPSQEAINRIELEGYLMAAEQLINGLRVAYTASLDGKTNAPQMMNDALKTLDRSRKKFLGLFPRERKDTPTVNELESKTRRGVWDARENEILLSLAQALEKNPALLEDQKTQFTAMKTDTENAIFKAAQWFHSDNKKETAERDREHAKKLVTEVLSKAKPSEVLAHTPEINREVEEEVENATVYYDERKRVWRVASIDGDVIQGTPPEALTTLWKQSQRETPISAILKFQTTRDQNGVTAFTVSFATPEEIATGKLAPEPIIADLLTEKPKPPSLEEPASPDVVVESSLMRAESAINNNRRAKTALILLADNFFPIDPAFVKKYGTHFLLEKIREKYQTFDELKNALNETVGANLPPTEMVLPLPDSPEKMKARYRAAVASLLPHLEPLYKEKEELKIAERPSMPIADATKIEPSVLPLEATEVTEEVDETEMLKLLYDEMLVEYRTMLSKKLEGQKEWEADDIEAQAKLLAKVNARKTLEEMKVGQ